jgi:hypothetical protein
MMVLATDSVEQTLALLVTFLGIGILVNFLIVYIVLLVMGERRENQERQRRLGQ